MCGCTKIEQGIFELSRADTDDPVLDELEEFNHNHRVMKRVLTCPIACSFSWFSLKKVGCPFRSKQNFFKAGGVGVSARGKIFGSR